MAHDQRQPSPLYIAHYLARYRAQIPVRMVQVGLAGAGTAFFWSPVMAGVFIVFHYALYAMLLRTVARGERTLDDPRTYRRLQVETGVLTFVLGIHICTLALQIFEAPGGRFQHVSLLLAIALLMLAGLQVHMSRLGFLVGVTPQIVTLIYMGLFKGTPVDPTTMFGTIMFICCIVAASWRQQTTDRRATELTVEQEVQNARLQQALDTAEQERARAEEASRAKSHILAVASHEIRTPLNVVLGLAEGLRREAQTPSQKSYTDGIQRAGAILLRLLNAVLDLAKAEAGAEVLRLSTLSPAQMLEDVASVWAPTAQDRGMEVALQVDPEAADLYVDSDFTRVEQTLVNLLSNAIKLSEPGQLLLALKVTKTDGEARLRFEIADRGPGVKPEDRERIFAPFEQTDAGTAKGGTGLGLAICRSNVDLLQGRLGVEAREGGGAVFWFEFAARIAEPPVPEVVQPETATDAGRPLHILIAEDNPANRQVIALLLEPTGCEITFAVDGQEAVDAFTARPFDLVFMDAMMPVMDGVTAVARIRASEGEWRTPMFMLTANVFEEDLRTYLAAGADGVVKKPIQVAELYRCLNQACERIETRPAPAATG